MRGSFQIAVGVGLAGAHIFIADEACGDGQSSKAQPSLASNRGADVTTAHSCGCSVSREFAGAPQGDDAFAASDSGIVECGGFGVGVEVRGDLTDSVAGEAAVGDGEDVSESDAVALAQVRHMYSTQAVESTRVPSMSKRMARARISNILTSDSMVALRGEIELSATPMRTFLRSASVFFALLPTLALVQTQAQSQPAVISVDPAHPGAAISPQMYGIFFEDINFAADGGLYPERIKNRSFEFSEPLTGWKEIMPITPKGMKASKGELAILTERPLNATNPHYLQARVHEAGAYGFYNTGFRGMGIHKGADYRFSALHPDARAKGHPR